MWSLFSLGETLTDRKWVLPMEHIEDCRVGLILAGQAVWTINDRPYPVAAGDAVVILPGATRSAVAGADGCFHVAARLMWRGDGGASPPLDASELPDWFALPPKVTLGLPALYELKGLLEQARTESELARPHYAAYVDTLLRQFFIRLYRAATSGGEAEQVPTSTRLNMACERAVEYIHSHLGQPIRVGKLATLAGYSEAQFRRRFRQAYGIGPLEYIQIARLRRAKDLLISTTLPVTEIASAVGFHDPSYFSRHFRKAVGVSPRAYRDRSGGAS